MKNYLAIGLALLAISCSKKETSTQNASKTPEKETVFIERSSQNEVANPISATDSVESASITETTETVRPEMKDLSGKHPLTLQWISWDRPGTVNFKKVGLNQYEISGNQTNGSDYLRIKGHITQISDQELQFEGSIETNVASNGGKCLRTGSQMFLVTQNRKYWRLQNMVECFGLTDYVDIYF